MAVETQTQGVAQRVLADMEQRHRRATTAIDRLNMGHRMDGAVELLSALQEHVARTVNALEPERWTHDNEGYHFGREQLARELGLLVDEHEADSEPTILYRNRIDPSVRWDLIVDEMNEAFKCGHHVRVTSRYVDEGQPELVLEVAAAPFPIEEEDA